MKLVDRFLKYVTFDTQSDELTNLTPPHQGKWCLPKHLNKSCKRWV